MPTDPLLSPQYELLTSIWPAPSETATAVVRVRLDSVPILIEDLRQALVREDYPAARSQAENLTRWLKAVESSMIAATGPCISLSPFPFLPRPSTMSREQLGGKGDSGGRER